MDRHPLNSIFNIRSEYETHHARISIHFLFSGLR